VKGLFATLVVAAAVTAIAASAGGKAPDATGSVFVPNPVQSTGDESLTDQKDSDAAVPASAYSTVPLTNLDGSGYLNGDYATVKSSTGKPAYSATGNFAYTRSQDQFEQVMAARSARASATTGPSTSATSSRSSSACRRRRRSAA